MKLGNVNEVLKSKIADWLLLEKLEAGNIELPSDKLRVHFDMWVKGHDSDTPNVSKKLFTQTLSRSLPFKRIGSGTVFFVSKKLGDL